VVGGPENDFMAREQDLLRIHNLTLEDDQAAVWQYAKQPVDLRYVLAVFCMETVWT
jgi:hypothetical protein